MSIIKFDMSFILCYYPIMNKKRGRPKLDDGKKLVSLHVMISPGMKKEIDRNSIQQVTTVSQFTRKLLSIGISIDHFQSTFGLTEQEIIDSIIELKKSRVGESG